MVMLVALVGRLSLLGVTVGVDAAAMVATWTALPLLAPSTVTLAFRTVPTLRLLTPLRPVTVMLVAVALVTLPVTPLLKVTLSWAAVGSKAAPRIVMLVAFCGR